MEASGPSPSAPPPPSCSSSSSSSSIKVTRLSDLYKSHPDAWKEQKNGWGETPTIDFGFAGPFRFYTPQALAALNKEVDDNLGHVRHTARSKCLRGVPSMIPFLELSRLASLCSDLVGVRVCPHALKQEWTHVNVQLEKEDKPVDAFHYDYVPFVCVTMLRKKEGDESGKLVLEVGEEEEEDEEGTHTHTHTRQEDSPRVGEGKAESTALIHIPIHTSEHVETHIHKQKKKRLVSLCLAMGESVLLQGSYVKHQANQSVCGCRLSLVVSLMPASVWEVDMTRVRLHSLPLGEDNSYLCEAMHYRAARLLSLTDHIHTHTHARTRMLDEFRRWLAQVEGCGCVGVCGCVNEGGRGREYVDVRMLLLFVKAYYL